MWPHVLLLMLSASPSGPARYQFEEEMGELSDFIRFTQGWEEDPALDLTETILRGADSKVFENRDGSVCVGLGRFSGEDAAGVRRRQWRWVSCPAASDGGLGTGPCHKLISGLEDLSVLGERCSKEAVAYAEVELASCGPGMEPLERLLRRGSSMAVRGPKGNKEIQALRNRLFHSSNLGDVIGCVTAVTSPDGRVRVWDVHLEQQDGSHPIDEETYRDLAYLQWLTPDGKLRLEVNGVREDFFLDAIVDEVVPVPGQPHAYLVTGRGASKLWCHRFAEVISLEGAHPTRVKGAFLVDGQKEDVLIFTGGWPETGKERHCLVYNHRLQFEGRRLWVKPVTGHDCCRRKRKPFVLGEWTGEVFEMKEGDWGWFMKLRGTKLLPGRVFEPGPLD